MCYNTSGSGIVHKAILQSLHVKIQKYKRLSILKDDWPTDRSAETLHFISHFCSKMSNRMQFELPHYFPFGAAAQRPMVSSFKRSLDHTQRHTTVRTPLDEWSSLRSDFWQQTTLTNTETFMPRAGFEPTISAGERSSIHSWYPDF